MWYVLTQEGYATSIPPRGVSTGDKLPVTITAVSSPLQFWCQIQQANAAKLGERMQGKLNLTGAESFFL